LVFATRQLRLLLRHATYCHKAGQGCHTAIRELQYGCQDITLRYATPLHAEGHMKVLPQRRAMGQLPRYYCCHIHTLRWRCRCQEDELLLLLMALLLQKARLPAGLVDAARQQSLRAPRLCISHALLQVCVWLLYWPRRWYSCR